MAKRGGSASNSREKVPRQHLQKNERFPRLFKEAARVIKEVKSGEKGLKTAVYSTKLRGSCLRKVYGLACSVLKNLHDVDKVISRADVLAKVPHLKEEAAEILVHEAVFKKHSLPGKSKPILAFERCLPDIVKAYEELSNKADNDDGEHASNSHLQEEHVCIPKYARVNTLLSSTSRVISDLTKAGFNQLSADQGLSRKKYRKILVSIEKKQFIQDIHFQEVLVFSHKENIIELPLYKRSHILVQDKASFIPAIALNPPEGSVVLDCCAAPGMKTVHLSSIMKNSGQVYAVDKDKDRFSVLKKMLKEAGVRNCRAVCTDFTKLDPNSEPYSTAEYILLDPSCSGSGIANRFSSATNNEYLKREERIQKLSRFQITLLKHALSFPCAKRVVYSTCSVHEEENEYVVEEVLRTFSENFEVVLSLPDWTPRGLKKYSFGKLCIRAVPRKNLTNGFFVAVFQRRENT